jgi:lipopolysaccharide export LptBFGC system permease protein LptF
MLGDLDGQNSTFDFIAKWTNLSTLYVCNYCAELYLALIISIFAYDSFFLLSRSLRNCGITGQLPNMLSNLWPNLTYLWVIYNTST